MRRRHVVRSIVVFSAPLLWILTACDKSSVGASEGAPPPDLTLAPRVVDSSQVFADSAIATASVSVGMSNESGALAANASNPGSPATSPATVLPAPPSTAVSVVAVPRASDPLPTPETSRSTVLPVPAAAVVPTRSVQVIPIGTTFSFVVAQRYCAPDVKIGDEIAGTVDKAVDVDGAPAIDAGASITLKVSGRTDGSFTMEPVRATTRDGERPVVGRVAVAEWDTVRAPAAKRGVFGAILGAAAGAGAAIATGRDVRTTVAAGTVGAGAGAAVGVATRGQHLCLPARGRLAVQTSAPIRVSASEPGATP